MENKSWIWVLLAAVVAYVFLRGRGADAAPTWTGAPRPSLRVIRELAPDLSPSPNTRAYSALPAPPPPPGSTTSPFQPREIYSRGGLS
jgi:hypothetical protein